MILTVKTDARTQFKEITEMVRRAISESGVSHGICMLFVPHTTAAITINENAELRGSLKNNLPFWRPIHPA